MQPIYLHSNPFSTSPTMAPKCWVKYVLSNSTLNCQPEKVPCEMQALYVQNWWLLLFSPCCSLVVVSCAFLSYCRLLLDFFGHDRDKNDSGIDFTLSQPWIAWFCCMHAMVFLRTMWSGIEGWVCLRNLGLGATQRELDGWISSPQP